jgi:endonuclease VIII
MSEGPEVKIIADKLATVLLGRKIDYVYGKRIGAEIKSNLVGAKINNIQTFGKNIVISFSSKIFLRNHMMMWGKWRIYDRTLFDQGLAHPPPGACGIAKETKLSAGKLASLMLGIKQTLEMILVSD